jgi:ATP adenylyltransferase
MGLENGISFQPGTLFETVRERSTLAERAGALRSIPTSFELVEDGETGVGFMVRMVDHLARKREAASAQQRTGANPFLPYNRELFVADVSETHLCLLNKYNVLDHHLLIVTRRFEEQESALTLEDFEALWLCMAEGEGLGFYNAGAEAGASQPHKHLQLVSVPIGIGPERTPIDPLLATARYDGPLGTVDALPLLHSVARLDAISSPGSPGGAEAAWEIYHSMLRRVGIDAEAPLPYNLLVTWDWMFLLPRTRGFFHGIEVNSLGFAGTLLARDLEQLAFIKREGPMTLLRNVAFPRE